MTVDQPKSSDRPGLSRRERQIMDALFRIGPAGVGDVRAELPDAPSYSAVRTMLGRLREKGHVTHQQEGAKYVYRPTVDAEDARQSALDRMVGTFFGGSTGKTVAALLDHSARELTDAELDELAEMIQRMKGGKG